MQIRFTMVFALLLFWVATAGAQTQNPAANPDADAANSSYQAKDWTKAAELYGHITAVDQKNGRAWYRLGVPLHGKGENDKAIGAFQKSMENGVPAFLSEYQIALAYASMKNNDKAFEFLQSAMQHGYSQPEEMQSAPELAVLRSDARFAKLMEQAHHNQKPCVYAPENRQFDFWVGEWDVVATQGDTSAGTSKIERILDECVILENWTSASGPYQGKSYNTYNTSLNRWEQFWVDNSQGMIHFYGNLKNGVMDYWTEEMPQPDGKKLKRHLQFIPQGPNKVRQFSQGSNDGGKTWFVEYDLTYNRTK